MKLVRKILRIVWYTFLLLLVFAIGAVGVLTLTQAGRDSLAGIASSLASSSDRTVRISGVTGLWAGPLTAEQVIVEDAKGPWLALRGVEIEWSPLALLSSTFKAERVAAKRVEIVRSPERPSAPRTSTEPFSLPISFDVKQIDMPDIALGEELVGGRVASISAKGKLIAVGSPLSVDTDLSVVRKDGVPGDLDAKIHYAPSDNLLNVDIRASEPSGGILAGLLQLPGKPSVDILVSGSGSAADWAGTGTFAVDGAVVTTLSGKYRLTDSGTLIEAKGDGEFARFVPESIRRLLDGKAAFDVSGTATSAGGLSISRATLESSAISATASGSLDPQGATDFSLQLTAKGEGVPFGFGTDESPINMTVASATVRAFGDGRAPALDIAAVLPSVSLNTTRLTDLGLTLHSDNFDLSTRTGPVSGMASAKTLVIDNPTIAPLVAGEIRVELAGALAADALTVNAASLRSDAIDGSFAGSVSLTDGRITLDLKADLLAAALPAALRPVLGERVAVSTSLERDTEGNLSANALALKSDGLAGGGTIRIAGDQIDADIKGTLVDVSPVAKQASGDVAFTATAKGPVKTPDVAVSVTSDRMVVASREITGFELTASGRADLANPAAAITVKGNVAGQALNGNAALSTADGKREVKGLSLTLGPNRISGDLVLDEKFVPVGTIEFNLPDIGPLASLALQTAEGDLSGTIAFTAGNGVPQVTVRGKSAQLRREDASARGVAIDATVTDYIANPAVAGSVKAAEAASGTTKLTDIDLALSRDGVWTRFSGGASLNGDPLKAAGRVKLADGVTTVELDSAETMMRGIKATLAKPSTIVVTDGQARLDNLALGVGGGSAVISGTAGTSLALTATLSGLPATLANNFAPGLDAAGSISGTVKINGAAANPNIGYTVDWTGAQTSQTRAAGFGAMTIRSTGTVADKQLKFDASLGDGSGLTIKGGGSVGIGGTPQLNLAFDGGVGFGFLTERLAAQGLSLSGSSSIDVKVSGPATAPVISGSIRASGARFIDARSGIAVNDVALDVSLGNGRATISRLSGTLSTGGTVTASGSIGIDAGQGFPADLAIKIVDGRYTDGQVVTTTLNGDLSIKGPLVSAPTIAGTINLGKTVITVPDRLPGSLATLDVKHKNASAAVREQDQAMRPAQATGGGSGLKLDLTVNAPQQIFIQGRGLDAELGGSLRLTGPVSSPQATGQFDLRRGRLSILGRRLTFTSGTLGFSGSLVPYLDLAAESAASDATVTVLVNGPANNPKFTFESVPVLPEDEVLARLVFGRSMSNLSPVQIAQLAEAAGQFAGVGGPTSLLNSLRNQLGVDDLDVKSDATGGTAVSVGKYLNDRTYITIEKGDKAGSGKAAIDLNVGKGVKLRGEATDAGEAKGGIFFEKEY